MDYNKLYLSSIGAINLCVGIQLALNLITLPRIVLVLIGLSWVVQGISMLLKVFKKEDNDEDDDNTGEHYRPKGDIWNPQHD